MTTVDTASTSGAVPRPRSRPPVGDAVVVGADHSNRLDVHQVLLTRGAPA